MFICLKISNKTLLIMSFGSDRTNVLINSEQLWLPIQDRCKIKPVSILSGWGRSSCVQSPN